MTYEQARASLMELKGLNGGRRQWHYTPNNAYVNGDQAPNRTHPGVFETQFGVAPSEKEISDFWIANGGGGKKSRRGKKSAAAASLMNAAAATSGYGAVASATGPKNAYEAMLLEAAGGMEKQNERAFAANKKRYDEEHGLATGVLNSGMAEINNWGNVQYQENADAAQRNLDKINTDLTDYGLANSTNRVAAKLNSDKNLALTQQDLSERKSDRMIQTNRTLTGDLRDVVRSRVDNAPDPNQLMQIYAKLGEAQAIDQARANAAAASGKPRKRSLSERIASFGGGGGRRGGGGAAAAAQGFALQNQLAGGLAGAMGMLGVQGMPLQLGAGNLVSNRYPQVRQRSEPDQGGGLPPFPQPAPPPRQRNPAGTADMAQADLMRKTRGMDPRFKGQVDPTDPNFGPYYWQQNPMARR